ncbi:hypothetical protein BS78_03G040500 [Paspalum vaginatum]|nr:hypothetical protein BS78_03G040500 [Paspalum vaginatum]
MSFPCVDASRKNGAQGRKHIDLLGRSYAEETRKARKAPSHQRFLSSLLSAPALSLRRQRRPPAASRCRPLRCTARAQIHSWGLHRPWFPSRLGTTAGVPVSARFQSGGDAAGDQRERAISAGEQCPSSSPPGVAPRRAMEGWKHPRLPVTGTSV